MSKTRYPGVEALSDGRKRVRLRVVDPRTGRTKEVDRIVTGTVEEAVKMQQEWREEIRDADHIAKEVPRLRVYVESWLRSKALGLKTSTAATYADLLGHHVLPHLGDFYIDKISDADVRKWQAKLAGDRAGATVNGAVVMLRMVLADAVVEYRLSRNPAERVRRLPMRTFTDEEPNLLTAEELGRVMAGFREHEPEHYPLAITLALTGLRYGEATALRWTDLDEKAGLIRIVRAQWSGVVSTTKTGTVRSVPLVPELAEVLNHHRAKIVAEHGQAAAPAWVFPSPGGGLLRRSVLRWPMARVLKAVGISKRVSVHGLRRTFNNLSRQVGRRHRHTQHHGPCHRGHDRALLARGPGGEAPGCQRHRAVGAWPGRLPCPTSKWGIEWGINGSRRLPLHARRL